MVEMGMSAPNEIKDLCYAAKPMMGIITNIGVSHIEHLGSRENILKAKLELADALPDGATLLLCDDNDLLQTVDIPRLHVVRYGLNSPRAETRRPSSVPHRFPPILCCMPRAKAGALPSPALGSTWC